MATFNREGTGLYPPDQKQGKVMGIADKNYYLDDAGEPTTDQSKAAIVIAHKGVEVTPDMAAKHPQIKTTDAKAEVDPAQEAVAKRNAAEDAAVKKQSSEAQKKSTWPSENK